MHIFHWSISIWRCCCCSCSISPKDRQCTFSAALFWISWSVISKNPTNLTAPIITTLLSMAMVIFAYCYWLTIHDDHYHHQSHSTVPIESRKAAASSVFTAVTAVTTTTTIVIDGIINFIGNINCVHLETDRVCVRHRCCTITAWWASSFLLWERRQTWCGIHQAAYHHSKRGGR